MVRIDDSYSPTFDDYILVPKPSTVNSRLEVNLTVSYVTKYSKQLLEGIPIFCANMSAVAGTEMGISLANSSMFTCLHKFVYGRDIINMYKTYPFTRNYVFTTVGIKSEDFDKFEAINSELYDDIGAYIKLLCIDVANGYISKFLDTIEYYRECYPDTVIMAGNVCTAEGCERVIKAGADIVKVNIGTGAQCDTSHKAAVGRNSMKAILDCVPVCNNKGALLVSDGGYSTTAKIAKGLACGAHGIMCGTLFAGYDENCGEFITDIRDMTFKEAFGRGLVLSEAEFENRKAAGYKFHHKTIHGMRLYGMSSKYANDRFCGGLKDYRTSEGKETIVSYKGPVKNIIQDIKGSLASTCTYLGIKDLKDISHAAHFERI